jgi:ABC-type Fe3+ transport system permease subunit
MIIACLSRFAWIALLAAAWTHSAGWRWLRELAQVDGAGAWRTTASVIVPVAWPTLLGAAALVGVLALTEVPATMLIRPPVPTLVPMLMAWVHNANDESMIRASLLLAAVVVFGALAAVTMIRLGIRRISA